MRRPLIFRARIAKANNEPHDVSREAVQTGLLLLFLFFGGLGAFLAFHFLFALLMTSGSAGATATTAASTGFSSSTRSATTCASTLLPSVSSLSLLLLIGSSLARRLWFSIRPLTSILNSVGMSAGRHSTSTSRVTTS